MVTFEATIKKFDKQGEKTGWSYIEIPEAIAQQLVPGNKKAFRVKGKLDDYQFAGNSLLPMGGGDFILALNTNIRKNLRRPIGAKITVEMTADKSTITLCPELLECLADEPKALDYFNKIPPSHRKYYSNWVESAKTEPTKAKRIAQAVSACARGQHYGEMIRSLKKDIL